LFDFGFCLFIVLLLYCFFVPQIEEIYHETKKVDSGKVATYIPQLARVNPEYYGISVCTIDGQRFDIGDTKIPFSAQSTSKPITYAIACEQRGEELVHQHVGREPSGRNFNELVLNSDGLPHNPLINSGAIMSASLIKPDCSMAEEVLFSFKTTNIKTTKTKQTD
jgi:glutaminase